MNAEDLQKAYAAACTELGHLVTQKRKLEVRLKVLEAEIDRMDAAAGELAQSGQPKSEPAPKKETES